MSETGDPSPNWWRMIRRLIIFGLGCAIIIDALLGDEHARIGSLVIGLVMVGVLPLDDLVEIITHRRKS